MATVQLLLLTVVLTLPSVEQLSYRNLQYAPTIDEVRMLGRLEVWTGFPWIKWESHGRWWELQMDVAQMFCVCPPAWLFLISDIEGTQMSSDGLRALLSHPMPQRLTASSVSLWSSNNLWISQKWLFRISVSQWKSYAGWCAQYKAAVCRGLSTAGYVGVWRRGFLRYFDV